MKRIQLHTHSVRVAEIRPDEIAGDEVVIFLHEALGSIGQWKNFPALLCRELKRNGFVYERQGHGDSDAFTETRGVDYLHRYALEELPALLEAVFPPEQQFILVGHSDGGTIALIFARKYPQRVKALVTLAAHAFVERETLAGIEPAVKAFESGKLNGLQKYHGDKTHALFHAWADTWRAPYFTDWNILSELDGLEVPALIAQGSDDQYGTPEQVYAIARCFIQTPETALIPATGHHPHLEKTGFCVTLIADWLKTVL